MKKVNLIFLISMVMVLYSLTCCAEGFSSLFGSYMQEFSEAYSEAAQEFNEAFAETSEEFNKAFAETSVEFNKAFAETSKEFNKAFSNAFSDLGTLFESEDSNGEGTEQNEEQVDENGSVLGNLINIYGGLVSEELGIPETIHYGDYELFKKDIDIIEAFFREYASFMKPYDASDLSMLADYTDLMAKYVDAMRILESIDESKMSAKEEAYFSTILLRINKILYEAL